MARPSEYNAKRPEAAEFMAERWGADDAELAAGLGISVATLYRWKKEHPEFCEAVNRGKAAYDDRVVTKSLRSGAVGYEYVEKEFDGNGKLVREIHRYRHPDSRCQALWWLNRHQWQTGGNLRQLGAGPAGEAGRQELVDDPRVGQLANDVLEARHGTKIRVESHTVDRSPETVVTDAEPADGGLQGQDTNG
jgi:hypothetical protein